VSANSALFERSLIRRLELSDAPDVLKACKTNTGVCEINTLSDSGGLLYALRRHPWPMTLKPGTGVCEVNARFDSGLFLHAATDPAEAFARPPANDTNIIL